MKPIEERLDLLKKEIQTDRFLKGKGLSNEVNIQIFSYDPADELVIHQFLDQLSVDHSMECHLHIFNLYEVFLKACEDLDIMDAIPELEEEDGSEYLLEQLQFAVTEDHFINLLQFGKHQVGKDVMVLTGVGSVFPFMRMHRLLEAIQPYFSDIPVLVMYPGIFTNYQLKLFGKLKANNYYRAFNML